MDNSLLRLVLALTLAAHGIGHILFLVPLLGLTRWKQSDWGQSTQSWLFRRQKWLSRLVGSLVWGFALLGFCAAAYGFYAQAFWWRVFAVDSAVISILGLILFWRKPPGQAVYSALIYNFMVLIFLYFTRS